MSEITLIYPHQLYSIDQYPALQKNREVWLVEEPLLFGTDADSPFNFHKQKLLLHRASMQLHRDKLETAGYRTRLIEFHELKTTSDILQRAVDAESKRVHLIYPDDYWIEQRLRAATNDHDIELVWHDGPGFLNTRREVDDYFADKDSYFQTKFYQHMRQKLDILLTADGSPIGGKWSFDPENRKKLSENQSIPKHWELPTDDQTRQALQSAREYIESHFENNFGNLEQFNYPLTHAQAKQRLTHFLSHKLHHFGDYQDAITTRDPFLFHSVLSSALNCGLLTPRQVVDAALERYHDSQGSDNEVSLNQIEGFIRQIIGWREFIRGVYWQLGVEQRSSNFFDHQNLLEDCWYTGDTGIPVIDHAIHKTRDYAYAHHIERLMVLGNAMLLAEIHPDDIYHWFMEVYIDAYDWVMVPNVYAMSQFAAGGTMTTKPYFSSSNYIKKMSDATIAGGDWEDIWDGLFWRFMSQNREKLQENTRMGMLFSTLDRMSEEKKERIFEKAEQWITKVTQ